MPNTKKVKKVKNFDRTMKAHCQWYVDCMHDCLNDDDSLNTGRYRFKLEERIHQVGFNAGILADVVKLADLLRKGKLRAAGKFVRETFDTADRESLPLNVWKAIEPYYYAR